ncbi:hypothetical protein C2E23DRAFT_889613 [Lenzites betulinus]|nr:hypothetical protein C2E23DRAFT_889613 [Lenzites betulinus]
MDVDLDHTFGVFLIGTLIGVMLYGLTVHQTYQYFRMYTDDSLANKALVVLVTVLETFHSVICCHVCYYYLIKNYGRPETLETGVWSINVLTGLSGIIIILSQTYFARRVFLIGSKLRILVYAAVILLVGELAFSIAATAQAFAIPVFAHFQKFTWLISAGAAMAVLGDVVLASVLVIFLKKNTTGMKRYNGHHRGHPDPVRGQHRVVNFLLFIFSLVSPSNLVYTAFGIVATKCTAFGFYSSLQNSDIISLAVYANSLLAALNARKYLAERAAGAILSSSLINIRATRVLSGSHLVSPTTLRFSLYEQPRTPQALGWAMTPEAGVSPSRSRA